MSKNSRAKLKKFRDEKKRARKAAQKKQYESWKLAGINTKSKRVKLNAKRKRSVKSISHPLGPCGNIGCKKCNPQDYNLLSPWQLHIQKVQRVLQA